MDLALVTFLVGVFSFGFFGGGIVSGRVARTAAKRVNLRTSYVSLTAGGLLVLVGLSSLLAVDT
eukprot:1195192-Prorocentrum_minimum.AAC.5